MIIFFWKFAKITFISTIFQKFFHIYKREYVYRLTQRGREKMGENRRITMHNIKVKTNKHNDRSFDLSLAEHIDQARLDKNLYWNYYTNRIYTHEEKIRENIPSFAETENAYYNTQFADGLKAKNDRYIKNRHKEKVQTMAQYQYHDVTCPMETIYQFGDVKHPIPLELHKKIVMEQLEWEQKTYPNVVIVNWAIHGDESVAHTHARKVFIAYDKDNNLIVNQSEALKAMEIERPEPNKKQGRYNNPMMTYAEECRTHLIEVCQKYGLNDIELIPKEYSKKAKKMQQVQYEKDHAKNEELKNKNVELETKNKELENKVSQLTTQVERLENQVEEKQNECFDWADKCMNEQLKNQDLVLANKILIDINKKLKANHEKLNQVAKDLSDPSALIFRLYNRFQLSINKLKKAQEQENESEIKLYQKSCEQNQQAIADCMQNDYGIEFDNGNNENDDFDLW